MRINRHLKILEIITKENIETQQELAEKLVIAGFSVTQATVSRDIRELKLTKITNYEGKQIYTALPAVANEMNENLIRVFIDSVISIEFGGNIIVIKTHEGMAMAVAVSLDKMNNTEILGTIAGDDTIFCVLKTNADSVNLKKKLDDIINNNT